MRGVCTLHVQTYTFITRSSSTNHLSGHSIKNRTPVGRAQANALTHVYSTHQGRDDSMHRFLKFLASSILSQRKKQTQTFICASSVCVLGGGVISRDTLPIQNQLCLSRIAPHPSTVPQKSWRFRFPAAATGGFFTTPPPRDPTSPPEPS